MKPPLLVWSYAGIGDIVVLIAVNPLGLAVLLACKLVAVLSGEVTVVCGTVRALLAVNCVLMSLQLVGAPWRDLTGCLTLMNAGLFVAAASIYMVPLMIGSGLCQQCSSGKRAQQRGQNNVLGETVHTNVLLGHGWKAPLLYLLQSGLFELPLRNRIFYV